MSLKTPSLLDRILEPGGLTTVFQPIFENRPEGLKLHALECLTRGPKGTNVERADILFEYVRRKRAESLVDRACIATALATANTLPGLPHLTVNVHASTLGRDRDFLTFIDEKASEHEVPPGRLTIEIAEQLPFWDSRSFQIALDGLKERGIAVALDDVGREQSNYKMILDCRPDFFKIDRFFVKGCNADYYRLAILESVTSLAARFGARVVAEGLDNVPDIETVKSLGVPLFQGFYYSPPRSLADLRERYLPEWTAASFGVAPAAASPASPV